MTETTIYRWKKRFGNLGVPELRELRQLREENRRLKGVVADLTLDRFIHDTLADGRSIRVLTVTAAERRRRLERHALPREHVDRLRSKSGCAR